MDEQAMNALFDAAARKAVADGVEPDSEPDGSVHRWVQANVQYTPDHEFWVVFILACRIADLQAHDRGYANAVDEAMSRVRAKRAA